VITDKETLVPHPDGPFPPKPARPTISDRPTPEWPVRAEVIAVTSTAERALAQFQPIDGLMCMAPLGADPAFSEVWVPVTLPPIGHALEPDLPLLDPARVAAAELAANLMRQPGSLVGVGKRPEVWQVTSLADWLLGLPACDHLVDAEIAED
jgi:hypothetical protein